MVTNENQKIPFIVTDTSGMEPKQAAQIWKESINVMFDSRLHDENGSGAYSRVDACMLGSLALGRASFGPQYFDRPATKIGRDGMDHLLVQCYVKGRCKDRRQKTAGSTQPGDLWITDLSQPLATEVDSATNISLIIPRAQISSLLSAPDIHHQRIISRQAPLAQLMGSHLRTLLRAARNMSISDAEALTKPTLELVAATLNGTVEDSSHKSITTIAKLDIIKYIESNLKNPALSPIEIAQHFEMSIRKLQYLFETDGGVANFIQSLRLRYCKRELIKNSLESIPLSQLASQLGFTHQQSFSRAFTREFGVSPRCLRAMAKQSAGMPEFYPGWKESSWKEWITLMR